MAIAILTRLGTTSAKNFNLEQRLRGLFAISGSIFGLLRHHGVACPYKILLRH
jgi:hypothetical protein